MLRLPLPASAFDDQSLGDGIGARSHDIAFVTSAIVAATSVVVRELDLMACPGGKWVLAVGSFLVLARTLPH